MALQLASWLYGTSLAKLVGEVLVERFGVNLFPRVEEVLMPAVLGVEKTKDLLIFGLTLLFAGGIYFFNRWIKKRAKIKDQHFDLLLLIFAFLLFWQTYFVHSALLLTLLWAVIMEIAFVGVNLIRTRRLLIAQITIKDFPWQNAVLAGYWLMTMASLVTTSLVLRLSLVAVVVGIYLGLFSHLKLRRFLSSPMQLLFLGAMFLPVNYNLFWLGIGVLGLSWAESLLFKKRYQLGLFADAAMIILVSWNLRFFVGNYDFIEEGFWLGWLQRLSFGEVMYRDFLVYHPPLLPKFIYLILQIFGESVYSLRLALQILRVLGLIIYFYLLREVLQGKLSRVLLLLIALGITATMVRNNVEIRLGMGLLAILLWIKAVKTQNRYWLLGSGVVTSIAGLLSLETAVAAGISLSMGILVFGKNRLKNLFWWLGGGLLVGVPIGLRMLFEGSLLPAIEQLSFYSGAFSAGYFNLSIPSTPVSAYYQWSLFDEYLSSQLFGWELAKLGLLLGIFLVGRSAIEKRVFDVRDKLIAVLSLFCLILFRGSLGRSDGPHLLFSLLTSLVILAVVLEKEIGRIKTSLVLGVLLVVFARGGLRTQLDNWFLDVQTHGQVFGSVQEYDFERMGVKVDVGVEVYKLNDIVKYLDENYENGEKVFMFPWMPDLYFFSELKNPTKNDLPYAFFSEKYQKETIAYLEKNPEVPVVFNPLRSISGFDAARLKLLNQYIMDNYEQVDEVDMFKILRRKEI